MVLDSHPFQPKEEVRWLGYWFSPNMATTSHFMRKLALAQGAFSVIKRLSPPGAGLSTLHTRRLVSSLLLPVIAYGADLFTPNGASSQRMEVFWNKALRWATNCFSSTLTTILPAEAAIPPLPVLLRQKRRTAAATMACTPPQICPASARLPKDFPAPFATRTPDTARPNTWRKHHNDPLPWRYDPSSRIRTQLPIDALAYIVLPLLLATGHLPARLLHLLPDNSPPPTGGPVIWPTIKARLKTALLADWRESRPPPTYYAYTLSTSPHAFMGLPKFLAGRIHQMRSGKSYLAAHRPTWPGEPVEPTCPRCSSEEENFPHAVLSCPPRALAKTLFVPGVTSLEQESPVWSTPSLVVALAKFIKATATGFPDNMPPMGTGSPTLEISSPPIPAPAPEGHPQPTNRTALTCAFAEAWGASI